MADTIKLGEVSKQLKITNKDLIAKLAEHGIECKSAATALTEEQVSLVFDIYTQLNEENESDIIAAREEAIKAAKKAAEPEVKQESKPEEKTEEKKKTEKQPEKKTASKESKKEAKQPEKTEKKEEKTEKTEVKAAQKPAAEAKPAANNADEKKKKQKHHTAAKKQTGQKIDLSSIERDGTDEEFVVKTEERKRHVDTRISNVDLDKIESRERIENLVPENIKADHNRNRNKKNRGFQEQNQKKKDFKKQQPKKIIPKKVITEVEIPETITVGEFAQKIGKPGAEVVKKLFMLGVMATMNQAIDFDTASLIGDDFGITVKQEVVLTKEDMLFMDTEEEDKAEDLVPRPPVVVVMGHVDHGKTSLLDAIRDTHVTSTEAGGITQHIGAYSVTLNGRDITFLDTPGHEAFTTMRARGAQVTDIAILVVAADDGIMPQTIEAINHAKAAGVTVIVAINKIDKEGANPERVKQALVEYELIPEEWGGDTVVVEVSAKQRINIDGLLEMVLLVADMKELKANPNRSAHGTVIEARVDKGKGPVATVLVQNGTLKVGDIIIAGTAVGRVRAMVNDKGRRVKLSLIHI